MATIAAIANGAWSNSSTWFNNVFPTSADDVFANTRTVYINQDINVKSLNTTASGVGGIAGGLFYNTGSISITAGEILPGTTSVLTLTGSNNIFIRSNKISGSSTTANAWGVIVPGSLTPPVVSISSFVSGGFGPSTNGGIRQEAGTVSLTGNVIGGAGNTTCPGIYIIQTGNYPVNFTCYGNIVGGDLTPNAAGIHMAYLGSENTVTNSSITIYGNISGSAIRQGVSNNTSTAGVLINGTIPVSIYGNLFGGTGGPIAGFNTGQSALIMEGTSTAFVNGNVYSSIPNLSAGIYATIRVAGVNNKLDILGDLIHIESLNPAECLEINSITGNVSISGNLIPSQGLRNTSRMLNLAGTNTLTIYGNVSGGRGNGISFGGGNILNIYGDVYGGNSAAAGAGAMGIFVNTNSRGRINIYGTLFAGTSSFCHGIAVSQPVFTNIYAKKLKGNAYGIGSLPANMAQVYAVGAGQNVNFMPTFNVVCEELEFGPFGAPPIITNVTFLDKTTNSITMPVTSTSSETKTLVDPNLNNIMPDISSVRLGINYSADNLVGVCNIPTVENVEFGVPVDNSFGIAALSPSSIWNTLTTELTSLSATVGYKLNNVATSESVGHLIAAFGS